MALTRNLPVHIISPLLVCLAFSLGDATHGQDVLHHWGFEAGDGFLQDSVGGAVLTVNGADVTSVELPSVDRGAPFIDSLAKSNTFAADFGSNIGGLQGNIEPIDGDFTVELLANLDRISGAGTNLVSQVIPDIQFAPGWQRQFAWSLTVSADESSGSVNKELALGWSDGLWQRINSGLVIDTNTNYHIATNFDIDSGRAIFSLRNLDSNELSLASIPVGKSELNTSNWLLVGDTPDWTADFGGAFNATGILDEVRISSGVLSPDAMLVSHDPATIVLSPWDIYHVKEGRRIMRTLHGLSTSTVSLEEQVVAKFDLPESVNPNQITNATLKIFVEEAAILESSELSLFVAQEDNGEERFEFGNPAFVDSSLPIDVSNAPNGEYVELDVTEFIKDDYIRDGDTSVSSFRFGATGEEFSLSMPRSVSQQPQLILSLATAPFPEFDCDGNGVVSFSDLDCVPAVASRDFVLDETGTLLADLDGDGEVGFSDFLIVSNHFGTASATYAQGNIDLTDGVDFLDFLILSANFGRKTEVIKAIPEPNSGVLLLTAMFVGLVTSQTRIRSMRKSEK